MNENEEPKSKFDFVPDPEGKQSRNALRFLGMREQLDWMRRQIEYSTFAEKYKLRYELKRGEIYEFDWGLNINAEFSLRHYGVVLQDSNQFNPLVIVCPLKTNHSGAHPRSDVDLGFIPGLNTHHPTLAVVNQIRALDKLRLYTKNVIGEGQVAEGKSKEETLSDLRNKECSIIKLDEHRLQIIIDSYYRMMIKGDQD